MANAKIETNEKQNQDKSDNYLEKLMLLLLKIFSKQEPGNGGGMPLDQAINEPGAKDQAAKMLEDKSTQWLCKKALEFSVVRDLVNDYLKENRNVKEFAKSVLNDDKLKGFKEELQQSGLLEKMDLTDKKTNVSQINKQDKQNSPTMTTPSTTPETTSSIKESVGNLPEVTEEDKITAEVENKAGVENTEEAENTAPTMSGA